MCTLLSELDNQIGDCPFLVKAPQMAAFLIAKCVPQTFKLLISVHLVVSAVFEVVVRSKNFLQFSCQNPPAISLPIIVQIPVSFAHSMLSTCNSRRTKCLSVGLVSI
jgi:hypothetical protein